VTLSKALQEVNIDLGTALNRVKLCATELKEIRSKAETAFYNVFKSAEAIAREVGLEDGLTVLRRIGRQIHRGNAPAVDPETHFQVNTVSSSPSSTASSPN